MSKTINLTTIFSALIFLLSPWLGYVISGGGKRGDLFFYGSEGYEVTPFYGLKFLLNGLNPSLELSATINTTNEVTSGTYLNFTTISTLILVFVSVFLGLVLAKVVVVGGGGGGGGRFIK